MSGMGRRPPNPEPDAPGASPLEQPVAPPRSAPDRAVQPVDPVASRFFEALTDALRPLQQACLTLIEIAAAGAPSATEVARQLTIEQTLAWRIWRLAHARSAPEASPFVTGATALETFLRAAAREGADEALLCTAREAHTA